MKKIAIVVMVLCFAFATKDVNARSYVIAQKNKHESRVGVGFSIKIAFPGEGKVTRYKSRNKNLEAQLAGLSSAPKVREPQEAYFEKYGGSLKALKELGHGITSFAHGYNTKSNGQKRLLPGYSTLTKEGSIFAPIFGLVAFPVNGISALFGGKDLMYNAWEKNPLRTLGTLVTEIGVGVAIGSSSGGSSSNNTTTANKQSEPEIEPKPKSESEPEPEPEPKPKPKPKPPIGRDDGDY